MSEIARLPLVSIIILNYNAKKLLLRCLKALLDFTEYASYEILVVDNGSIDNSIQAVQKMFRDEKKIKVVALPENFGYAEGNNKGYKYISKKAEYVVILNNDVITNERNWLRLLVEFLEKHQDVGEAQPLILNLEDSPQNLYGWKMNVFGEFSPIRAISNKEADKPSQERFNECFSAYGAAIIARRKLIDEIGLFNGRFFLDCEDADFSWRLRLLGYKIVCVHSSKVYHLGRATKKIYPRLPLFLFHRLKNRIYMLLLNYHITSVIRFVPWIVLSYAYETTKDVLVSTFSSDENKLAKTRAMATTKSLIYLLVNLQHIWGERVIVQERIRTIKDSEIIGEHIIRVRSRVLNRMRAEGWQ
jgi:GT2 family glycosyltransferase